MKLFFVSLGCDKNLSDSEHMLSLLERDGFSLTDDETEAEVIVVNTCCFIGDAKEESIQTLIDLGRLKTEGKLKILIAAGCLAQRYAKEIKEELPEVDGVVGTNGFNSISEAIRKALDGKYPSELPPLTGIVSVDSGRILTTGGHYAFLKIAEGCDKACTYCIIPHVRGLYRSIPEEDLVSEARELVRGGVRELNLVAQEVTLYGRDLYGRKQLCKLISRLSELDDLKWIRLLYCYPEEIDDELIKLIGENPKVCHYLDIPIQHIDDDILKRMGRRTSSLDIYEKIERIREAVPDIALRTTLMTGFPGESEDAHGRLCRFVEKACFDRLGVFKYSREEGTPAAAFSEQVDESVKQRRYDELMSIQQQVSARIGQSVIGSIQTVFVEGRVADEEGVYVGRTYRDAPEVDGYLFFNTPEDIESGRFIKAQVSGANEYDLTGDMIYEPAK